eukprot:TRINITY_DN10379_c0_g1_i4.p1 TRINITY_DN10379_c0_g1~~TRINITY_DN10379_c0_g1_i4.p1  ORF type:complete len:563 (+),score=102.39 TRINITY_DN10379_c0_g1_i4:74-1762(+)
MPRDVVRVRGCIIDAPVFPATRDSMRCFAAVDVCCKTGRIVRAELAGGTQAGGEDVTVVETVEVPMGSILLPGFIDCHVHASQFPFCGTGISRPLMADDGFLKKYAFPTEDGFRDVAYAEAVYDAVVRTTLAHGTTTAVYYATIHRPATVALARRCRARRQRALVGKIQMDQFSLLESYKHHSVAACVEETEAFLLDEIFHMDSKAQGTEQIELVQPVITPRFIPSCSVDLLLALGDLARRYPRVLTQTHVSESIDEVEFAKVAWEEDAAIVQAAQAARTAPHHPTGKRLAAATLLEQGTPAKKRRCDVHVEESVRIVTFDETVTVTSADGLATSTERHAVDVQQHRDLTVKGVSLTRQHTCDLQALRQVGLAKGLIAAHAVLMSEEEVSIAEECDVRVAHCPLSNFYFANGSLDVRRLLLRTRPIKIGLGTDVAGGYTPCMLNAMRSTVIASKGIYAKTPDDALSIFDALHLATAGGAAVCSLGHTVGCFDVGKEFDAQVLTPPHWWAAPFLQLSVPHEDAPRPAPGRLTISEYELLERTLHLAEPRRHDVWVRGRRVDLE